MVRTRVRKMERIKHCSNGSNDKHDDTEIMMIDILMNYISLPHYYLWPTIIISIVHHQPWNMIIL